MKIQIIQDVSNLDTKKSLFGDDYSWASFRSFEPIDKFDLNIVDLNSIDWNHYCYESSDDIKDLLIPRIRETKKTKILFLLPSNKEVNYKVNKFDSVNRELIHDVLYLNRCLLVRLNIFLTEFNVELAVDYQGEVMFEKKVIKYDFYFKRHPERFLEITKSQYNDNITTVCSFDKRIWYTTLIFEKDEDIDYFIKKYINKESILPNWLKEYDILGYENNKQQILKLKGELEEKKKEINQKIEHNKWINSKKEILISNSDTLQRKVVEILYEMFKINDLINFKDENQEDFAFSFNKKKYYIGEIKGENTNVKNSNISQLVNHRDKFLEKHSNIKEEDIICLLIMNHQRDKEISKREKVNQAQIEKAKKEKVLIIETITLLKIYEKFLNKEIDKKKILELFEHIGILEEKNIT